MNGAIIFLEKLVFHWGKLASWATTFLVLLITIDVIIRWVFNYSEAWIIDLEWQIFAFIFLIGASYTLQEDKHVRVDVFYTRFSEKGKAWVNLIGTLLLCIPWIILLISKSYNYAINSWIIREGSSNPGGLPAKYVIKTVMVIGFVLLLAQSVALVLRSIQKLRLQWR